MHCSPYPEANFLQEASIARLKETQVLVERFSHENERLADEVERMRGGRESGDPVTATGEYKSDTAHLSP